MAVLGEAAWLCLFTVWGCSVAWRVQCGKRRSRPYFGHLNWVVCRFWWYFTGKMIINRWTLVRSLFVGETLISIVLLWWQMDEGKGEMNIAPAMTHNPPRKRWRRRHVSGAYNLKVCQLCARLMFEGISLQKIWPLAVERWHVWFPEQGIVEALAVSTCPRLVVWVILYRSQYVPMLSHHWTLLKAIGPSDRYSNLANHR